MLPASIQVCPIELPGRGRRQDEAAVDSVAALADALATSLPLQVLTLSSRVKAIHCLEQLANGL